MKVCTNCLCSKPLSDFRKSNRSTGAASPRGGHGVQAVCKQCSSELRKPGLAEERRNKELDRANGIKVCGSCRKRKPLADFNKRKASRFDGRCHKCAECAKDALRKWNAENPGAFKEWYLDHKDERSAHHKAYRARHKARISKNYSKWAKENKHIVNSRTARRNASKLMATPKWANLDAIKDIYAEAARLTAQTGIRHEVDHIYPLQGKYACGLHCEANLQILTKVENVRKSNRMPEDSYEPRRHRSLDERHRTCSS